MKDLENIAGPEFDDYRQTGEYGEVGGGNLRAMDILDSLNEHLYSRDLIFNNRFYTGGNSDFEAAEQYVLTRNRLKLISYSWFGSNYQLIRRDLGIEMNYPWWKYLEKTEFLVFCQDYLIDAVISGDVENDLLENTLRSL